MQWVELLTNVQFNALKPVGSYPAYDIVSGLDYFVSFAGARSDHYDITPTTENDALIFERAIGGIPLRKWRHARPTLVTHPPTGRFVCFGFAMFMHHIHIGSGRPGPRYLSFNEVGPPWSPINGKPPLPAVGGGHICGYLCDSTGGAGDAPNPACRAEANALAMELLGGKRGGQARAAAYEAYYLWHDEFEGGLTVGEYKELSERLDTVEKKLGALERRVAPVYKTIKDVKAKWGDEGDEIVSDALKRGIIEGTAPDNLGLSWQDVRWLVIAYRREHAQARMSVK